MMDDNEKVYRSMFGMAARLVFTKEGDLTWFGWACLIGAGFLAAAVLSMFQGCAHA